MGKTTSDRHHFDQSPGSRELLLQTSAMGHGMVMRKTQHFQQGIQQGKRLDACPLFW